MAAAALLAVAAAAGNLGCHHDGTPPMSEPPMDRPAEVNGSPDPAPRAPVITGPARMDDPHPKVYTEPGSVNTTQPAQPILSYPDSNIEGLGAKQPGTVQGK